MTLICFDTHVLIWGLKKTATEGQEEMIDKTSLFLKHIEKSSDIHVIIPTVVLAELMLNIPSKEHQRISSIIHKSYLVAPFDAKASFEFARIWQDKWGNEKNKKALIKNTTKNELKADCFIVATALARKASKIYSHDDKLCNFGKGYIDVCKIPSIPIQNSLEPIWSPN